MAAPLGEVEQAFRTYWQTGAVGEDWPAWADLFAEDADYIEHVLGSMHGRDEIKAWIVPIMDQFSELYTFYEWHMIEGNRVVVYMQNRRDHPDPTQPPIDFPGITILRYAGGGKWASEEDYWALPQANRASKAYAEACAKYDLDHAKKRTRQHWPDGPAWVRPAAVTDL
ncbi:MAG: nuclear transport factor 2 family protein [Actinobacteria bacterium]|nr:nuclear transport factor 2 family protein [Actinomycetota bacterium]